MTIPSISNEKLDTIISDTLSEQSQILLARAYHNGVQPIHLTERQKEFLDIHSDNQFCLNLIRTVVNAVRDELEVIGFQTSENDKDGNTQAKWFWDLWTKNKMDSRQGRNHEAILRDRESFIILDWEADTKVLSMIFHERYISPKANAWEGLWTGLQQETKDVMTGNGQGVFVIYQNDDIDQPMIAAVQQWYEAEKERVRRTVYYDDRIERFFFDKTEWVQLEENPKQDWTTTDGKPIGIPVIHFYNPGMLPEAWDAIPPQDAINKTWVDVLAIGDSAAMPLLVVLGLYPTVDGKEPAEDGSNVWKWGPGEIIGNKNVKAGDGSIDKMEGSDPTPLMNTMKDQVVFLAQITDTPVSRFLTTGQIASAETLKEQEQGLKKKAKNKRVVFGDAYEQVMFMARRIFNALGGGKMDETVSISTVWKDVSSADEILQETNAGIPQEVAWSKFGYTDKQIQAIKDTPAYRIKFLQMFWEAYNTASQSGVTVEGFCAALKLSADDTKLIMDSVATDTIPPTGI